MKFKYILVLMTALAFTSCNNWLDVTPQGEVEGEDLLTNEKGYNAALNGIYYNLTSTTLYGKELSYGMMDVLAQYWDLSSKSRTAITNSLNSIMKMRVQNPASMQFGRRCIKESHRPIIFWNPWNLIEAL